MYKPETEFRVMDGIVYNLKQDGWSNGSPRMVNDITLQMNTNVNKELVIEIMELVKDALNKKYKKSVDK